MMKTASDKRYGGRQQALPTASARHTVSGVCIKRCPSPLDRAVLFSLSQIVAISKMICCLFPLRIIRSRLPGAYQDLPGVRAANRNMLSFSFPQYALNLAQR